MSKENGSAVERVVDELEVQAWLARAEFQHPSLHEPAVREEVSALARIRDELRLQMALGKLEARDEFEVLEKNWEKLKSAASKAATEAGESITDLVTQIRDGYKKHQP